MIKRLRTFSIVLMLALGVAGIGFGIYNGAESQDGTPLLVTIISIAGSALFGASLTMFIDQVLGTDLADIKSYLFRAEKFESAPEYLRQLDGQWHHYDLSAKDGKIHWQYSLLDFHCDALSNTLRAALVDEGHLGAKHKYDLTAGYRRGSFVCFLRALDSDERDTIEIVPGMLDKQLKAHLGIIFRETWDGIPAFTYSIVARHKLVDGDLSSDTAQEFLFSEYRKLMKIYGILPIVNDPRLRVD